MSDASLSVEVMEHRGASVEIGRGWRVLYSEESLGAWKKRLLLHIAESDDGSAAAALFSIMRVYGAAGLPGSPGAAGSPGSPGGGPRCSLRLINFFVVNYCKEEPVVLGGHDVYREYQHHLNFYSRHNFDVFRRGVPSERIVLIHEEDGHRLLTTVAQLNFFCWASRVGVVGYIQEHAAALVAIMNLSNRRHRSLKKELQPSSRIAVSVRTPSAQLGSF